MTMNEASAQTPTAAPTNVLAFAGNHQIKPLSVNGGAKVGHSAA